MPYKYRVSQRKACKKYYLKNKERIKRYTKERGIELRKIVLEHYGNKCVCCGEKETKFLTIDHINNDGGKFRKKRHTRGGTGDYYWFIKNNFPKDLQVLCWNCNMAKARYGLCPHKE